MSQQNGNGHVNGKHNGPDFSALQEKALFAAQRAVDAVEKGRLGDALSWLSDSSAYLRRITFLRQREKEESVRSQP